ncbi:MAG TPA: PEP/pyruvate-binding domain-containing protein [Thermoanaerobaculia bacterium]|nr:PEP/pyruvate-binding domain-containing protein [Thermoanaerobaculia bacterium]
MTALPFDDRDATNAELTGGKGASLARMTQAGFAVPRGFCLTTDAYTAATEAIGLRGRLAALVAEERWSDVEAAAAEAFASAPVPANVRDAYHALGARVAVRSSATAEDLPDASFAGQQETFLDVAGEEAVLDAVRRCWASLWSARAMHYRHTRGIDHFAVSMAVVVQTMVDADCAGVAFTADPVSQRRDRIVIEAAAGLGEAIVSGTTAGDVYRLDRATLAVVERDLRGDAPILDDAQLLAIAGAAVALEDVQGMPQDVEFAFADGQLQLLQSRPITTLAVVDVEDVPRAPEPTRAQRAALAKIAERFPTAPKPLDNVALVTLSLDPVAHALSRLGLRMPAKPLAAAREQLWREAFLLPAPKPGPGTVVLPFRMLSWLRRDWNRWWSGTPRARLTAAGNAGDVASLSDEELTAAFQRVRAEWAAVMRERGEGTVTMYTAEGVVKLLVKKAVGAKRMLPVVGELLGGIDSITLEVNEALWRLSRDPSERNVHAFLAKYGHREGSSFYLSTPTWNRNPEQVRALARALAQAGAPPQRGMAAERAEQAKREVLSALRRKPLLRWAFRWMVERYRELQRFEEDSHFDMTRPLDALQALALEAGRRLVQRGAMARTDEVFLLTQEELGQWLRQPPGDAHALLRRRAATHAMVDARWKARLSEAAGEGTLLTGSAASAGVVEGAARIVRGEADFGRLRPGEVLVCPFTNPAWTPLFATAAAVVAETGGVASHAAIVAREYGIPAVLRVSGATTRIRDGQWLVVDGSAGTVTLAEARAAEPAA